MKPEFEKLLGDDKDKFIENLTKEKHLSFEEYMHSFDREPTFETFVLSAFTWDETPESEGYDFWNKVSLRT